MPFNLDMFFLWHFTPKNLIEKVVVVDRQLSILKSLNSYILNLTSFARSQNVSSIKMVCIICPSSPCSPGLAMTLITPFIGGIELSQTCPDFTFMAGSRWRALSHSVFENSVQQLLKIFHLWHPLTPFMLLMMSLNGRRWPLTFDARSCQHNFMHAVSAQCLPFFNVVTEFNFFGKEASSFPTI